jgi:hypothetical protein
MLQSNQQISAMIRTEARGGKPAETTWKGAPLHVTLLCQSPEAGCTRRPKCPRGKSENAMLPLTPAPSLLRAKWDASTPDGRCC